MKTTLEIPEIVVSGRSGKGHLAEQVSKWLAHWRVIQEWAVTSTPAAALMRREKCASVTVLEASDWTAPEVDNVARWFGAQQVKQAGPCFVVFYLTNVKHDGRGPWTRLLSAFPDPSKVEIARDSSEMRNTLEEVICKFSAECKRLDAQPSPTVGTILYQLIESMREIDDTRRKIEETLKKVVALPTQDREIFRSCMKPPAPTKAMGSPKKPSVPRASHLDDIEDVVRATQDLRVESGRLSVQRIAALFDFSVRHFAELLGRSPQALCKTPDSKSIQADLSYFERIARLRRVLPDDAAFRKWMHSANPRLDNQTPLDLIEAKDWQALADLVDDILTGSPR